MKEKYVVYTTVYNYCTLEVEAESSEEAVEIVREMDYEEHHLKASLSSVEIGVDEEAIAWEDICDDEDLIHPKEDELKINELERLIILNEGKLITRDDKMNDAYWNYIVKENEKLQGEIEEIRKNLKKGSS